MPTRVAPTTTVAPQASAAHMPAYREAAFRHVCAARVRHGLSQGVSADATLFTMAAHQRALAEALQDPQFTEAFAQSFAQSFSKRMDTKYAIPIEEARRAVQSILDHRVSDARYFAEMLTKVEVVQAITQEAAQPAPPDKPYSLPPEKQQETWERLVQEKDPRGPEGATHVLGYAVGQAIEHDALAEIYASNGPLVAPLTNALQTQLPNAIPNDLTTLANDWLSARLKPARAIADGLMPNGTLYQQGAARADQLQYGQARPATERLAPPKDGVLLDRI